MSLYIRRLANLADPFHDLAIADSVVQFYMGCIFFWVLVSPPTVIFSKPVAIFRPVGNPPSDPVWIVSSQDIILSLAFLALS
jgi:hypothetical protein